MPTHAETARFLRDWQRLTHAQQARFRVALAKFIHDVGTGSFRSSLRVKDYRHEEGVFEMTWADDGRALFRYGDEVQPGEPHIEWLRIGTHDIFD